MRAGLEARGPAARAHLERAADLARHSLGEARRSVHDLTRGPLTHRTLPEARHDLVTRWSGTSATPARFTVAGPAEPLHPEIAGALLRIAEEALANVARHAGATPVGAERVLGVVEIESGPGAGTAVSARVPLVGDDA